MTRTTAKAAAIGFSLLGLAAFSAAQEPASKPASAPATQSKEKPKSKGNPGGLPDLVGALKKSPGCLGVETARTQSGKSVIFAWFKDKQAVMAWYKSGIHRAMMDTMIEGRSGRKPLENLKDDGRPVLAIASITFSDKPRLEGVKMPISQIAIELYQPVDGGISLGGRFAPESMDLPGIQDYTPKK
ncbi:MAG: hypothetical protein SFX72_21010 [Isosphaeraceae bacterium]|nr:hypothetical protein [Isosphaeraceae bacterium]